MKSVLTIILCFSAALFAEAQTNNTKKQSDIESIKSMAGCYKVTFDFAETFSADTAYEYYDRYHSSGIEYVFVLTDEPNFIQLQHLLIINDSTIIKHWRQDWVYEETNLLSYDGGNNWKTLTYTPAEVEGTWTQKVYQVDDSPRYESKGTWVHVDGKHYWEAVSDAPLPRREATKRSDYNIVRRHSRMQINGDGWYLEQDNEKILRTEEGDKRIVWEKGMETFTTGDYNCQPAITWWENNKEYWADVRDAWTEIFAENTELNFQKRIDNKMLWQQLFEMGDDVADGKETDDVKSKVKTIITQYL